jgi:hypothetical protein
MVDKVLGYLVNEKKYTILYNYNPKAFVIISNIILDHISLSISY